MQRAAFILLLIGTLALGFAMGSVLGPGLLSTEGGGGAAGQGSPVGPGEPAGLSSEVSRLRQELSAARKERDAARARAERAETQVQTLTKLSTQLDAGSGAGREATPLSPEEVRARSAELRTAFDAAFARGDGKAVIEAFAALNALGEGAFATIAELAAKLDETALKKLGISHMSFWRAFRTPYLAWAATNGDLKAEQRSGAIYGLAYREPERIVDRFGALLGSEKDPEVVRAMLWALGSSRDPAAAGPIVLVARTTADGSVRALAVEQLGDYDTSESVETVRAVLARATDAEVKRAATFAWRKLRPPESGVLVELAWGSALQARLQRGDLVTAVNGAPVATAKEMQERLAAGGTVTVLRLDGTTETLTVRGKIDGMSSRDVVRKE